MGSWDPVLQTAFWNEQIIMIDQEHIRTGDLSKSVYITPIEARSQGKIIELY